MAFNRSPRGPALKVGRASRGSAPWPLRLVQTPWGRMQPRAPGESRRVERTPIFPSLLLGKKHCTILVQMLVTGESLTGPGWRRGHELGGRSSSRPARSRSRTSNDDSRCVKISRDNPALLCATGRKEGVESAPRMARPGLCVAGGGAHACRSASTRISARVKCA